MLVDGGAERDSGVVVCVQAQRHALVSISKVLRSAHRETLSPVLQNGRTIALAASVLYHTANSDVSNQQQWQAWCCRVLWDATEVDQSCCNKVCPPDPFASPHPRCVYPTQVLLPPPDAAAGGACGLLRRRSRLWHVCRMCRLRPRSLVGLLCVCGACRV